MIFLDQLIEFSKNSWKQLKKKIPTPKTIDLYRLHYCLLFTSISRGLSSEKKGWI